MLVQENVVKAMVSSFIGPSPQMGDGLSILGIFIPISLDAGKDLDRIMIVYIFSIRQTLI